MLPSALRKLSRNQWALVATFIVVLGLVLVGLARHLEWTWGAIFVLVAVGLRVFLGISRSDQEAAQNLGRNLRAKRDARKREASESQ